VGQKKSPHSLNFGDKLLGKVRYKFNGKSGFFLNVSLLQELRDIDAPVRPFNNRGGNACQSCVRG
jgi:hypothetical protein